MRALLRPVLAAFARPLRTVTVSAAQALPWRQRPEALLFLMALAMPLAFSVWTALLNNFTENRVGFDGEDIGLLHAVREIPGFLAFLVVYLLLIFREQSLALVSLALLGVGAAATGLLPSFEGLLLTTIIGSIGFHYYETVNQSLQLQWIPKARAPVVLGQLAGVGSSTAFVAFVAVWIFSHESVWGPEPPYEALYLVGGLATCALAAFAWSAYPRFTADAPQRRELVLRRRYWLYYVLTFFAGARRQIFLVFAGFMLVEKFDFGLNDFALLLIINHLVNVFFAPLMGRMTQRFGERAVLTFEYLGLIAVFSAYAMVEVAWMAAALFVLDHLFFGLAFAQRTYFQKIADAQDIAPTAAVAFTINHIAAVTLPWPLGLLYLADPGAVFWVGAALATLSLAAARLIPRRPSPETPDMLGLGRPTPQPAL